MSLEAEIKALREAIEANTAALQGGKSAGASKSAKDDDAAETKTTRTRRSSKQDDEQKAKYSAEDVKAAAVKVKDELGTKVAKQIIKDHGADELAALKPAVYEDFINACEKALNGEDEDAGGDSL